MTSKYWMKTRKTLFPSITDWYDPQDHIRFEKDVGKLDWFEWFFMHPTGFTLINYSSSVSCIITFGGLSWFCYTKGWFVWLIFLGISLIFVYELYIKIGQHKQNKGKTFYDVHMREYKGDLD